MAEHPRLRLESTYVVLGIGAPARQRVVGRATLRPAFELRPSLAVLSILRYNYICDLPRAPSSVDQYSFICVFL